MGVSLRVNSWESLSTWLLNLHHVYIYIASHIHYIILHHTSTTSCCITHLLHHIASHLIHHIASHTLLHHIASLQLAQYCISSHHRQYTIQQLMVYSAVGWGVVRCTLKALHYRLQEHCLSGATSTPICQVLTSPSPTSTQSHQLHTKLG